MPPRPLLVVVGVLREKDLLERSELAEAVGNPALRIVAAAVDTLAVHSLAENNLVGDSLVEGSPVEEVVDSLAEGDSLDSVDSLLVADSLAVHRLVESNLVDLAEDNHFVGVETVEGSLEEAFAWADRRAPVV